MISIRTDKMYKKLAEDINNMKKRTAIARKNYQKAITRLAKIKLMENTPEDTGRAVKAIEVLYINTHQSFVGWTEEDIIRYIRVINDGSYGSPDGWVIEANGNSGGNGMWLVFPKKEKEYNLPSFIGTDGETYYIARKVTHPYQEPEKFIERTMAEVETAARKLFKTAYVKTLKSGGGSS